MQPDGNLVVYDKLGNAIWSSQTNGQGTAPYSYIMQNDGNLVVYDNNKKALWSSGTNGQGTAPYQAILQDDCSFVVRDYVNKSLWSSTQSAAPVASNDSSFCTSTDADIACKDLNWSKCNVSMQSDGNLVVYDKTNTPIWSSNTSGKGVAPYSYIMQKDGNLVVYDKNKTALWSSHTNGQGTAPYQAILLNNCSLTVRDNASKTLWASAPLANAAIAGGKLSLRL